MSLRTAAFGVASGVALFSLVAILRAVAGYPQFTPLLLYWAAGGAGVGWAWMTLVELQDALADNAASRENTQARTELLLADADARRAALPAAEPVAEAVAVAEPDDRGWYLCTEITLLTGQVRGFTDEGLSDIMGSDGRPKMQRFLLSRGVLALSAAGYAWAENVTLADALRRLKLGGLAPFPEGLAPEVRAPIQVATRRDGPTQPRKGVRVVESTSRVTE